MTEPFLGQICLFGFSYAPRGWAKCSGQLLPISQNSALFALLGTQYGGDGVTTFGLPNLQGRTVVGENGSSYRMGQTGGYETVTMSAQHIPAHKHDITLTTVEATLKAVGDDGDSGDPTGHSFAKQRGDVFSTEAPDVPMHSGAITISGTGTCENAGGGQAHENRPPFQVLNFCISLQGIFPPRD